MWKLYKPNEDLESMVQGPDVKIAETQHENVETGRAGPLIT